MDEDTTRVLILAHDQDVAALLGALLADAGYAAARARELWEVWALARAEPPDLLVVDVEPPRARARRLLGLLAADPHTAALPTLALCGSAALASEALHFANVRGVIAKPFDAEDLLAQIEQTKQGAPCVGALCSTC